MKKITILTGLVFIMVFSLNAQVAVNTDGRSPDNSAMLDVYSTGQGFLPPRMNTIQRESITSPAEGLCIFNTDSLCLEFWDGSAWYDICTGGSYTPPVSVQGSCPAPVAYWMDRNLGASQVATSSTDALAYGDLYQWGRATEGHEKRTSGTTGTNATTAVPNLGNSWDGMFITENSSPQDWLTPQDNTLWQGLSGTNNPCPPGYRLPTSTEWNCERTNWGSNNATGAYGSPLKLPVAGYRHTSSGSAGFVGTYGLFWSSSPGGVGVSSLTITSSVAVVSSSNRGYGFSVRCLKD